MNYSNDNFYSFFIFILDKSCYIGHQTSVMHNDVNRSR